jgi:hypothetical protein
MIKRNPVVLRKNHVVFSTRKTKLRKSARVLTRDKRAIAWFGSKCGQNCGLRSKIGLADRHRKRVITQWGVKKVYTKYSNHGVFLCTYSIQYCVHSGREKTLRANCM